MAAPINPRPYTASEVPLCSTLFFITEGLVPAIYRYEMEYKVITVKLLTLRKRLRLLHKLALERHRAKTINLAIYVVVAVRKPDVLHFCSFLHRPRSAFYRKIFDHHYAVAILQHIAVRVLHHEPFVGRGFFGVPFMTALGTGKQATSRRVSIRRFTLGTG